jgi:O-antigen ligase
VWLALRGRIRIVVIGYVLATVLLTGSRTALLALAAAVVAIVVLRPSLDGSEHVAAAPIRQIAAILSVAVIATVGAALPLLPAATSSLGDRTYFWRVALDGIERSPLIGNGGTAWPRLYESGRIPIAASYSPHNQWLDVLFASGFLGFVIFVILLGYLLLRDKRLITASATILIPILAASTLERPWSFAITDGGTFILLAALLCHSPPAIQPEKDVESAPDAAGSLFAGQRSHP